MADTDPVQEPETKKTKTDANDEVSRRLILLFKNFELLMVSETVSPDLHAELTLRKVRSILLMNKNASIKSDDSDEWYESDKVYDLLSEFLKDNPVKIAICDVPEDVSSVYTVNKLICVDA